MATLWQLNFISGYTVKDLSDNEKGNLAGVTSWVVV